MSLEVVILIVAVALAFDFMNGFHDAANSIATVVSTRVLSPKAGVLWAAFFNFVAAFGFGVAVASMIGEGIIVTRIVTEWLILSALAGAIAWDVITVVVWFTDKFFARVSGRARGSCLSRRRMGSRLRTELANHSSLHCTLTSDRFARGFVFDSGYLKNSS